MKKKIMLKKINFPVLFGFLSEKLILDCGIVCNQKFANEAG